MKRVAPSRRARALQGRVSCRERATGTLRAAEGPHGGRGAVGGQLQRGGAPASCSLQ